MVALPLSISKKPLTFLFQTTSNLNDYVETNFQNKIRTWMMSHIRKGDLLSSSSQARSPFFICKKLKLEITA